MHIVHNFNTLKYVTAITIKALTNAVFRSCGNLGSRIIICTIEYAINNVYDCSWPITQVSIQRFGYTTPKIESHANKQVKRLTIIADMAVSMSTTEGYFEEYYL
jgi:hypothetical protein|tara:strand:- start:10252 stop:10563 length:312 start_codon:yes stop_codon:yes gene_type:complete